MNKEHVNRVAAITCGNMAEYAQLISKADPSLSKRLLALTEEIDKEHKLHTISIEIE